MDDYQDVLRLVAQRLDAAGLAYMLSGSTALGFYGRPRMTRDLDLVIELAPGQERLITERFGEDFSVDDEEVHEAVTRRSMFNLVHFATVVKVDFIVRKDSEYRKTEFARRRAFDLAGQRVWVVSPEDLILSKLAWARESHSELQLRDVSGVMEIVGDLDHPYLDRWAPSLQVEALLAEVRSP